MAANGAQPLIPSAESLRQPVLRNNRVPERTRCMQLKELVEVIAKSLVDYPNEVVVTETEKEKAIVIELHVAASDMGKVIGKQGRIAKAIRSVVKAASSKEEKKVVVEILQ